MQRHGVAEELEKVAGSARSLLGNESSRINNTIAEKGAIDVALNQRIANFFAEFRKFDNASRTASAALSVVQNNKTFAEAELRSTRMRDEANLSQLDHEIHAYLNPTTGNSFNPPYLASLERFVDEVNVIN